MELDQFGACCGKYDNPLLKPDYCFAAPEIKYYCSDTNFKKTSQWAPGKYKNYLRYAYCLDESKVIVQEKGCGRRELYNHVGPETKKAISATNEKVCVWRLFSEDPNSKHQFLKYQFKHDPSLNKNSEITIFDSTSSEVIKFDDEQKKVGAGQFFEINSLDFNTTDVFLMIKIKDNTVAQSRIEFDFIYEEDFGLQAGGIFGIVFLILFVIVSIGVAVIWYLNKIGKIKIYIPRKFRLLCFKNWLSDEEKASGDYDHDVTDNVKTKNQLRMRIGI